jgi:23S rRNA (cytidine1920-2'-O)/16S rRNA (cytidine1409-2'-O)-methyltransferase
LAEKREPRLRLDSEITRRGLAPSRESARRLVMAGLVRVNSRPAVKPDLLVDCNTSITLIAKGSDYASRGAFKLIAALDRFQLDPAGRLALDIGASNGGFTDVLLRRGARHVIALDVGYGQLDIRLRDDPRVTVLDRVNVRYAQAAQIPYLADLVTVDVSFISLRIVLPAVLGLVSSPADIVALVKPQFEVGRGKVGKGGVVRDEAARRQALDTIVEFAEMLGLSTVGTLESPVLGAAGNREYLALFRKRG